MSDKPISVGDLVAVVRAPECCGNPTGLGTIFYVRSIETYTGNCSMCGRHFKRQITTRKPNGFLTQINRLKRIDPDILRDDIPTREVLTA